MICSNCKREVADDAFFCSHCGERLETKEKGVRRCSCGRELEARAKFCPGCGLAVTGTVDDNAKLENLSGVSNERVERPEANQELSIKEPPEQKQPVQEPPHQEPPAQKLPVQEHTEQESAKTPDKLKGTAKKPARLKRIFTVCTVVLLAAALIAAGVLYMSRCPTLSPEEAMAAIAETASAYPGEGMNIISAGTIYTVGLKKDGTVVASGSNKYGQCNVSGLLNGWKDIVAVSAGLNTTAGLKKDGTVVAVGEYSKDVKGWTDIARVLSDRWGVAGIKRDGTIICTDFRNEFSGFEGWTDIIGVSRLEEGVIGLKKDGTVVATGKYEDKVGGFKDIAAISSGEKSCLGLRKDGTVVVITGKESIPGDFESWNGIVSISVGGCVLDHTLDYVVGLRYDGTVVVTGLDDYREYDVSGWRDIVAVSAGTDHIAGLKSNGTVIAVGVNDKGQCDVSKWTDIAEVSMDWYPEIDTAASIVTQEDLALLQQKGNKVIAAGWYDTIALKNDGTTIDAGMSGGGSRGWKDIISVAAGEYHLVGLRKDGTVVAAGPNDADEKNKGGVTIGFGQCEVNSWSDIAAIAAGPSHTLGLKKDGTVVALGSNSYGQCDVSNWKDIIAISAGGIKTIGYSVGLKKNGAIITSGLNCPDMSGWTDITAISAGVNHVVGLKKDGTVVAAGRYGEGQCNVSEWEDILAISAGFNNTFGLKKDGTVVTTDKSLDLSKWTNIVAVSAGSYHVVGLKKDGTVVAAGVNDASERNVSGQRIGYGQCEVQNWGNIKTEVTNNQNNTTTPSALSAQNSNSNTVQDTTADTPSDNTAQKTPPDNALSSIYKRPGKELSDFYNAYYDSMFVFYEPICNSYNWQDFESSDEGKDLLAICFSIEFIRQLDDLEPGDNPREEKIIDSCHAIREKNGYVISFNQIHTLGKSYFVRESGTLNMSTNTMTIESKFERDGVVIARIVSELIMLKDGSYIGQKHEPIMSADTETENRYMARFMRITKTEAEVIAAYYEPDANFTYNSIAGKTDATPESMAEGYTRARRFIVKDGKTALTKY